MSARCFLSFSLPPPPPPPSAHLPECRELRYLIRKYFGNRMSACPILDGSANDFVLYFSAEPCDLPCPTSNQILSGGGVGAGGGGNGGRGSSPSVSGVAAPSPSPSQSHSSPYDLRRKSPPHPDPAPGTSSALPPSGGSSIAATFGSSSLPARKRPRRTCSTSTDGMSH